MLAYLFLVQTLHAAKHYLLCTYVYIAVPSCYVTPSCIGEPINSSITFADCCTNFGVSYDLDGRCQPCPSTSKFIQGCIITK